MADLGNIAFGIEVRGERDIAKAVSSLDSMQKKLAQVALAERQGAVAAGSLSKSTRQLQNALARQTGDLIGATKAAQSYRRQLMAMDDATLAATVGMQGSLKGFRNIELFAQQAGYQIGDFAVQVQSGTNPLVAFSQQASQLLGFMGPWGAVIGAATAITGGLIMAFTKGGEEALTFSDAISDLQGMITSIEGQFEILNMSAAELSRTYGEGAELVQRFALAHVELSIAQAETRFRDQIVLAQELVSVYADGTKVMGEFGESIDFSEQIRDLAEDFGISRENAADLLDELQNIANADTFDNQVAAVDAFFLKIQELGVPLRNIPDTLREGVLEMIAMTQETEKLKALMERFAAGDTSTGDGGGGGRGRRIKSIQEIIAERQKQIDQELELLSLTRERAAVREIEFDILNKYEGEITDSIREQVTATAEAMAADEERIRQLEELRDRNQAVADTIADSFGKALTSVVDGTKSVKDAFKDMARAIIADLYQMYVVKQITGFISGGINQAMGGGGGFLSSIFGGGRASGGTMSPNTPYLVGERGPELVMPSRQSTVMNADLTAKAMGGGESVNVTQVFNINGNGDEYIMGKIAQAAPRIADATKKSILDERRRGGVYKSVFG
jgi:hypothetical protein